MFRQLLFFVLLFSCIQIPAQWSTYSPMPGTRWAHVCAAASGRLYVAGGSVSPTWEYDPIANSWTSRASIPTARSYPGIASWGGMIYVLGGSQGATWSVKNERYDPATDTWTTLADMPQARTTTAAAAVNGKIYVLNGWNGTAMSAVDIYDIATDTWTTGAAAPTGRSHAKSAVVNDRIYLIGGYAGGWVGTNEVYDPASNTWQTLAPMPTARYIHAVGAVGVQIYAAGGYSGSASNVTESYNTLSNIWSSEAAMPTARYRTDGASVNGCFFVLGGYNGSNLSTNEGFCGVILPLALELRGHESGTGVDLEWTDGNADLAENYVIERASWEGDFEGIGQVSAQSNRQGEFTFRDAWPLEGTNLYRIRRVDRNGEAGNSAIVEVYFNGEEEIRLGWDGEMEELILRWNPDQQWGRIEVSVFDLQGQALKSFDLNAEQIREGSAKLSFSPNSHGIHLVRIKNEAGQATHKMHIGEL